MRSIPFSFVRAGASLIAVAVLFWHIGAGGAETVETDEGQAAEHEDHADAMAETEVASPPIDPVVARGEYLALAGNCASCHTVGGGDFMAGGVAFKTPFGTIYSTNITPDPDTGIGNWTQEQFIDSMRKGVRPNGEHLYPVFPYTAFTKTTDDDLAAMYAYLMSIPAVRQEAAANELSFPFSIRSLMSVWKFFFFEEGVYQSDNSQSEEWNRGAYLVEALAHCSACHAPRNFLGAEKGVMTGGVYNDKVRTGEIRKWSAPNLTSASNGLGAWSLDDVVAYLKTGSNSMVSTFGPMNEVIVNSTRHLNDDDIRAMAVYLKSLPADEGDVAAAASADVVREGESLYNVHCGTCHLPTGLGGPDSGPRLAGGSLVVQANDPASLINVILYGPELPDPPLIKHAWKVMEPFADELTDEEVAALTSFLRSSWGNKGGAVTVKQVEAQR